MFDATHVTRTLETTRTEPLVGIAVEFKGLAIPHFNLSKSAFFDGLTFFDKLRKINNKLLLDWLKNKYSLFHDRETLPVEVVHLFNGKSQLEKWFSRTYFHLLTGNGNILVIYFKGENKSNADFYNRMELVGISLAHLFDPSLRKSKIDDLPEDIHLLKQTNSL